jgi:hypothetical protein
MADGLDSHAWRAFTPGPRAPEPSPVPVLLIIAAMVLFVAGLWLGLSL